MAFVILRRLGFRNRMALLWLPIWISAGLSAAEIAVVPDIALPRLTSAHEVLALGLETARQSLFSVQLQGLVTYPDVAAHIIYVQDGSAGVRVVYTNADYEPVSGQMVVVEGLTAAGTFAPFVDCAGVRVIGSGTIPEPCVAPASRMAAGELFGEWVQVEGVVRDVAKEPGRALLFISSGGLRFNAVIQPFPGSTLPVDWLDAWVALRGVCWTDVDAENKPTGFTLYVPGTNHILFLHREAQDIFRQPAIPTSSQSQLLRQSDARVKVTGTVAYHSPSGYVYLQREDGAVKARLLVPLARGNQQARYVQRIPVSPLRPGERVEMVGAPTLAHFSPLLQDAEFHRIGTDPQPVPVSVGTSEIFAGKFDGRLISLKARLLASETRQAGALKHQVMVLQAGDAIFEAVWEFIGTNSLPVLARNSYVLAVGVCVLQLGELNQIRSFRLLLREPSDLRLLGTPPWWEHLPVGKVLTSVLGLGSIALIWIWLLRRQVAQRTLQLQTEVIERQRAQTELRRALTAERELNELRSRFVSMVSHEFRTPLGVILSAAENLDSYFDRLNPKQRRSQLDHVIQATRQMAKVMENVLFIGRADAGKVEFKPCALDLIKFCDGMVHQIHVSTGKRCPIHFQARPLEMAYVDENLLRHILNNLLTNAVKYSKETTAVQLTLERCDGEAIFRVQDQGIGIPEADQRQLFKPFHRGGNVGDLPGTGLGLVIVKRSVELHRGRITCQSSEGQGTTFIVNLPLFPSVPT